ncbi:MAU2 chromatid cohesion factor homolog isoform X1 [Eriocheir sinensis]|uniref:MAU2 chromatid cohesion factor homolog isoform X1 n=1 Tax=Eriocheir sinensis TaxID=95602 RepID=UPI0021C99D7B|nr:MAU2 chromatid cohesion factor homolog isoform X1 [Eriocheir sinensis]XP_050721506.1 MAU2 chromatid cohesion factor homolog isoform X1 [Eriocheir sinensis]XP_050721507.1 MAU2 chromatid cohesion factor homolog isoform X1 [Eriocheir sinensis]XP_050721508.1 MAU2 chromatid cohesion factor homolog isoform X1 [Eriocheir sinensis]XP_050721509.1 MAU2 chromatid cohesion factor homolog isoform X1 [Eriocheir sinensis]XP_050721510.1 MAU2 chromatid cohesion factor homolog isoform X1 [Eriocheir sinensis]
MANPQDACYLSLLALAERFRTQEPANIKSCVQCLQAVLTFRPPPKVEARTHLQLATLLTQHTTNTQLARDHLQQAWSLSMSIVGFDDVRFEAASELAKLYEQTGSAANAKSVLQRAIELSRQSVFWHCRLIFQMAQLGVTEMDYASAGSLLQKGLEYCLIQGIAYNQILFLLSKIMVMLLEGRGAVEIQTLLNQANQSVEQYNGAQGQKEHLRVFYLVLLVCHNLNSGQVKSVKPALKQLQQSIQNITQLSEQEVIPSSSSEMFAWLPREQLCVLVYLVSVMHSMQAGYMEKAQKYTDKALLQIDKLKAEENTSILSSLQLLLLEHSIMCHLIMGSKAQAIKEIAKVCRLLQDDTRQLQAHRAQLHTLLAVYAMSMNLSTAAEVQFNAALRTSSNHDLWIFANLNLAVVYLRCQRERDFAAIMDRINPDTLPTQSQSLRAASFYVQGLHAFFTNRHNDGKRFLRESLKMANAEDLNRLTSCSLVLLGHIFLALGNPREALNMVTPAMQLASKIPDLHLQLWSSAILKDLYRQFGDAPHEQESSHNHYNFSQTLLMDHLAATQLPEHQLITWTDGPFPSIVSEKL